MHPALSVRTFSLLHLTDLRARAAIRFGICALGLDLALAVALLLAYIQSMASRDTKSKRPCEYPAPFLSSPLSSLVSQSRFVRFPFPRLPRDIPHLNHSPGICCTSHSTVVVQDSEGRLFGCMTANNESSRWHEVGQKGYSWGFKCRGVGSEGLRVMRPRWMEVIEII